MIISHKILGPLSLSEDFFTPVKANEYIPLFALSNLKEREGFFYYSSPSFSTVLVKPNTIKNIKEAFEYAQTTRKITINQKVYFIAKGAIFSEQKVPIMICAMKKEAFLNSNIAKYSDIPKYSTEANKTFSYSNYVLFYSTSFFTESGLTSLNRRLQKEILEDCYQKGIEVRIISSLEIQKNTLANLFEVKKTKSLTQLEAYMQQVLPTFLYDDKEDTFIEQEFELVLIKQVEELSVEEEAILFDSEEDTSSYEWHEYEEEAAPYREEGTSHTLSWEGTFPVENMYASVDVAHTTPTMMIHTGIEGARAFEQALEAEFFRASLASRTLPEIELIDDTESV